MPPTQVHILKAFKSQPPYEVSTISSFSDEKTEEEVRQLISGDRIQTPAV